MSDRDAGLSSEQRVGGVRSFDSFEKVLHAVRSLRTIVVHRDIDDVPLDSGGADPVAIRADADPATVFESW